MEQATHSAIVNFLWGIADDVLRDVYVRGKYRGRILPMTVIRRLDCLLEPTKDAVLKQKETLDKAGILNQEGPLRQAAKQAFYNTSQFTLRRLLDNPKQLRANFQTSRRLLRQRPRDHREVRLPQPTQEAGTSRRPRAIDREVPIPRYQPESSTCPRRKGNASSPAWTTTAWVPSSRN